MSTHIEELDDHMITTSHTAAPASSIKEDIFIHKVLKKELRSFLEQAFPKMNAKEIEAIVYYHDGTPDMDIFFEEHVPQIFNEDTLNFLLDLYHLYN